MPNLSQSHIGQVAIVCKDVARGSAFYRDVLGLRHLFDAPPSLSFFDCGGVRLMLTTVERPEDDHPGSMLYFFVSDIEGVQRDLTAKGVQFLEQPHLIAKLSDRDVWLTAFNDSEGNPMGIMEERQRSA
jgi:predicted enzyme related to lactoylglutathione lyase